MKLHKHQFEPWANIYGDVINDMNARGVMKCKFCNRLKFVPELLPVTKSYNDYLWAINTRKEQLKHKKEK